MNVNQEQRSSQGAVEPAGGAPVGRHQREARSSGDDLPGLLTGCRPQSIALSGLRLSVGCESGAPVTSGHALLASCCVSTTLRTHAETSAPQPPVKWTMTGTTLQGRRH